MVARAWRRLRTGIAFVSFGMLGVSLGVVGVPWIQLRTRDEAERRLRAQRGAITAFRVFLRIMTGLGLARLEREGVAERLSGSGLLVVANHPTLIDAPAILACMRSGACITKQSNTSNPTMSRVIRAAGYIPNVGGQAIVDGCVQSLRQGGSLLLFPEGTRSPEGRLGDFQRGAAHIALESGRDLLPVLVRCDPPTLMRGQKWYDVPDRPFELRLRVGEPIPVAPYQEALREGESRARVARRMTAELREWFEKGLRGVAA
jgi:1-acyl-sn-glycerol-3-phosphate acyltransferase